MLSQECSEEPVIVTRRRGSRYILMKSRLEERLDRKLPECRLEGLVV